MQLASFERLTQAATIYKGRGYRYLDLPFTVPVDFMNNIYQGPKRSFSCGGSAVVASAEQSFLYLRSTLDEDVKYFSITPCFRDDVEDDTHQLGFMKLELFCLNRHKREELLNDAMEFFSGNLSLRVEKLNTRRESGHWSYDIVCSETFTELGSYYSKSDYCCGTGLAEPRTSWVISRQLSF